MHKIDTDSAVDGEFVDKNSSLGVEGTVVDAAWLNSVQNEICNVITTSGATLDKNSQNQLVTAIETISKDSVSKQVISCSEVQETISTGLFRISEKFSLDKGYFVDVNFLINVQTTSSGQAKFSLRHGSNLIQNIYTVEDLTTAIVNTVRYFKQMGESTVSDNDYYFALEFTGAVPTYNFDVEGLVSKN